MCGIVGYVGKDRAAPVLLEGLKKLEYRGYDSAGIALCDRGGFSVRKEAGRVSALAGAEALDGTVGIGHTRWATHGAATQRNAHPHVYGDFALVHNGIVENFHELRRECEARGETFVSETDSEVIVHLLARYDEGDLLETLKKTASRLKGSFALAVLCRTQPGKIALAREKSPLVVGRGKKGSYAASDVPALASECDVLYALDDGEFALLEENSVRFFGKEGEIEKARIRFDPREGDRSLGIYPHHMRREMAEIPVAIANSILDLTSDPRFSALYEVLCQTEYIQFLACGTAYHSGVAAKYAIEALARVPVDASIASEYRYRDPIVPQKTLAVAVSQSGETADTLAAAQIAKERGAVLLAVTNSPDSSLTRLADFVVETRAGREIAVAATKSYNAQLAVHYSLALALAKAKGRRTNLSLRSFPALAEETLASIERIKPFAPVFARAESVYFIGRGPDYCSALEGSLKLKEISYLPSEGYPAGELKHGTLALIRKGTPVVAVLTRSALAEKTMNAVAEVYARGAEVFLVTDLPEYAARREVARSFLLPRGEELFSPLLSVIPLQALAYYVAIARGNDPDKPRNLAKSVTVE